MPNHSKIIEQQFVKYSRDRLNGYLNGVSNRIFRTERPNPEVVQKLINLIDEKKIIFVQDILAHLARTPLVNPDKSLAKRIRQIQRYCVTELYNNPLYRINPLMLIGYQSTHTLLDDIKAMQGKPVMTGMLSQANNTWNPLMLALRYQPELVAPLLNAINSIQDRRVRASILGQVSSTGSNVLILAAHYYSDAIGPILEAINAIQDEQFKETILSQVSQNGWNSLIHTARYHGDSIEMLLDAINTLQDERTKETILSQATNLGGKNALGYALSYQPTAVKPLLTVINNLQNEQVKELILSQTNANSGENALHFALSKRNEMMFPILMAINELQDRRIKATVLTQINSINSNALMISAYWQPELINPLLAAINNLQDEEVKIAILKQANIYGWNTLMLAIYYQSPETINMLLTQIADLKPNEVESILRQTHTNNEIIPAGHNPLMLVATYKPMVLKSLLTMIAGLNSEVQKELFLKTNEQGKTALELAREKHYLFAVILIEAAMNKLELSTVREISWPSIIPEKKLTPDRMTLRDERDLYDSPDDEFDTELSSPAACSSSFFYDSNKPSTSYSATDNCDKGYSKLRQ